MAENTTQPTDTSMEADTELDPAVEDEINRDAKEVEAMNLDGANDTEPAAINGMADTTAAFEARIPAKKDATLREFLNKMDEYAPIVCTSETLLPTEADHVTDQICRYQTQSQTTTLHVLVSHHHRRPPHI